MSASPSPSEIMNQHFRDRIPVFLAIERILHDEPRKRSTLPSADFFFDNKAHPFVQHLIGKLGCTRITFLKDQLLTQDAFSERELERFGEWIPWIQLSLNRAYKPRDLTDDMGDIYHVVVGYAPLGLFEGQYAVLIEEYNCGWCLITNWDELKGKGVKCPRICLAANSTGQVVRFQIESEGKRTQERISR